MITPKQRLGFGLMRLPLTNPEKEDSIDIELMEKMADAFLERGFTYFDTAWMYCGGKSEEAAGKAIVTRNDRSSFTLTSKLPAYMLKEEADRDKIFDEQLRRTKAEYFDYYLLHDVNGETIETFRKLNCFEWALQKKKEGKIKTFGFSFHDGPELLDEILTEHPEVEFVQLQINYLDWESLGICSRRCYETVIKHNKKVIVMEPVKGGTLAKVPDKVEKLFRSVHPDWSPASWAIRFAASLDGVMVVLSGMSNMEQMLDNTGYMQDFTPLNDEEKAVCLKAAEIINEIVTIPCTGCSYCTVNCPMNIPIPKYFSLYNSDINEKKLTGNSWTSQCGYYSIITKNYSSPMDCLKCGECEKMCPQHLNIREYLEDVGKHFS